MSTMNKDTFWDLIATAKSQTGGNVDAMYQWLCNWLVANSDANGAIQFYEISHAYNSLAYKFGLWTAAMIMSNGFRSDDGFHYFTNWLIAQGKEVYLAALANPDSLAEIDVNGDSEFESLDYIGADAFELLTGEDFYDRNRQLPGYPQLKADLAREITYGEGIEDWHDDEAEAYVPNLYAKYEDTLPQGGSTT